MNQRLAQAAIAAVTDPTVEQKKGFCSRFVRQVVQKVYGNEYRGLFGASAIETGHNFRDVGLTVNATASTIEVGDILFKMTGSGGFGHVGIYVGEEGVAENSSTPIGRVQGAKGFRTLAQYGHFDLVGRIPEETPAEPKVYALFLHDRKIATMPVINGKSMCPVRDWAKALGFAVDWDEEQHKVLIEGEPIDAEVMIINGKGYVHVVKLIEAAGLRYTVDNERRIVTVTK
jgi:hypothetical protein